MDDQPGIQVVILAAGRGTRMNSPKPKILHRIAGKPLLQHTLELAKSISSLPPIVVVSNNSQAISKLVDKMGAKRIVEKNPQGTASSFMQSVPHLDPDTGHILVMNSDDSFLYTPQIISHMVSHHISQRNHLTFLTTVPEKPYPNVKKVIRNKQGNFTGLEHTTETNEVVCGTYIYNRSWVQKYLPTVKLNPGKNEYFITDLLLIALETNSSISPHLLTNPAYWWGVNTKEDLNYAKSLWKKIHYGS